MVLPAGSEIAVVFQFSDTTEIRYLSGPPRLGSRVVSTSGRVYRVTRLVRSGERMLTAQCVESRGGRRQVEPVPRLAEKRPEPTRPVDALDMATGEPPRRVDLGTRLLSAARMATSAPSRFRERRRMRDYLP
jgi:hypothetical protein